MAETIRKCKGFGNTLCAMCERFDIEHGEVLINQLGYSYIDEAFFCNQFIAKVPG